MIQSEENSRAEIGRPEKIETGTIKDRHQRADLGLFLLVVAFGWERVIADHTKPLVCQVHEESYEENKAMGPGSDLFRSVIGEQDAGKSARNRTPDSKIETEDLACTTMNIRVQYRKHVAECSRGPCPGSMRR